jgi:hypothetical protein
MADAIPDWAQDSAPQTASVPDWAKDSDDTSTPDWAQDSPAPTTSQPPAWISAFNDKAKSVAQSFKNYQDEAAKAVQDSLVNSGKAAASDIASLILPDQQVQDLKDAGDIGQTPIKDKILASGQPLSLADKARIGIEGGQNILSQYAGMAFPYMGLAAPAFNATENATLGAPNENAPSNWKDVTREGLDEVMNMVGLGVGPHIVRGLTGEVLPPEVAPRPEPSLTSPAELEAPAVDNTAPQSPPIEPEAPETPTAQEPEEPQESSEPVTDVVPETQNVPDWAQDTNTQAPQSELPKLYVRPSDSKDSFNVVDEQGDHVLGGFDSRQDAEDYIESANEPDIGHEPPEWATEVIPEYNTDSGTVPSDKSPVAQAVNEAAAQVNTNPTEAQKEAGNYKKGKVDIQGLPITIENPQGLIRSGIGPDGKPWQVQMPNHYGYIRNTEGMDGEHVDTYIGPNPESKKAFIVDQIDADTGEPDEHKVMLGYNNVSEAATQYEKAFSDGRGSQRIGGITTTDIDGLKNWLKTNATKKPATETFPIEQTPAGEQSVIPGAEKISDRELAERNMQKPLQNNVVQKAPDDGLFDIGARNQLELPNAIRPIDNRIIKEETTSKGEQNGQSPSQNQEIQYGQSSVSRTNNGSTLSSNETEAGGGTRPLYSGDKGTRGAKIYDTIESARKDAQSGQLNQSLDKAAQCYQTAGQISESYKKPTIIGTVEGKNGKRIYHAVNSIEEGGKTYIYDGTLDKLFTPEVYSEYAKWTPVKELTPAEVTAHGMRFGKWPAPNDLGLPAANTVKYTKQEAIPTQDNVSKAIRKGIIPPAKMGKPTSLYSFLRNNGGLKDEGGDVAAMGHKDLIKPNGMTYDRATELAHEYGYFPSRPSIEDLKATLAEHNGGKAVTSAQDIERVIRQQERAQQKGRDDPAYVEYYASNLGIDTEGKTTSQLKKAIIELVGNESGSLPRKDYQRAGLDGAKKPTEWALKKPIETIEKVTGKLTGDAFQKIGDAYVKVIAPELVSKKALRADAYMAKNKAIVAEARNALYKQSAAAERAWDRATNEERENFLEAQDTGNYVNNDPNNPAHMRYKALTDATFRAEKEATGGDPTKGYRDSYFPRIWEKPEEVKAYLTSPAMIKKYGPGWFNKARQFDLYREAKQAGFKLISNNPETLLQNRLMAGQDMIARMSLLHDLEGDGLATPARAFSIDKRIAKTEAAIADARTKYKAALDKINDPKQMRWDFADPAVNKYMKSLKERGDKLNTKLAEYKQEKEQYKLPPETLTGLKENGFKIIGPDDKVWHLDNDMIPLWKNVMDSRGLWENKGLTGSAYRGWQALRNTWVPIKLGLSLFHPLHVATIHVATGLASAAENLARGGKLADSIKDIAKSLKMGFGLKSGIGMGRNGKLFNGNPAIDAWNKPASERTVAEQQIVDTMNEGGFVPAMSERDIIHFRRSFENALHGNLLQKTVVMPIKGAQGILRAVSAPIFEHWIPALKTEAYLMRARNAIARDPSLANDAGRRNEVLRQIAKDVDRTYGEMNYDTLFWNKAVRDAFNGSFLSGGWKLAQLYYARGLAAPFKAAYKFAKTGEFNPKDISYNMMFSYIYGAMGLILGAAFTKMMGGSVNSLADMVFPQTGEKDKDGKPIRVSLPFFNKEFFSLSKDINTKGLIGGSAAFAYDQTLYKSIVDTLSNKDYIGRPLISIPSDLNQWAHQAWETVKPITMESYEKAEQKGSKFGQKSAALGIGLAPAYAGQTPFEQKVLYAYSQENPPKGDSYTASLKSDYRSAMAAGDEKKMTSLRQEMQKEGMTGAQIGALNRNYNQPFVDHAWKMLPAAEQHRLIESATDAEKTKYRLKPMVKEAD